MSDLSSDNRAITIALLTALIFVSLSLTQTMRGNDAREQVTRIVAQIQRADYEGNQVVM